MSVSALPAPDVRGRSRGARLDRRTGSAAIALAATAALASVVGAMSIQRSADTHEENARALRIEMQRLERRLRRLDAPDADATLVALGESRDGLRVRLVEALDGVRERRQDVTFTHRIDVLGADGEGGDGITVLRLAIEGRVAHGSALLELLEAVETARRPWPGETRGCVLQRVDVGRGEAARAAVAPLLFRCAVDLLHWHEPETSS